MFGKISRTYKENQEKEVTLQLGYGRRKETKDIIVIQYGNKEDTYVTDNGSWQP
jgi:hypothetical protein